MTLDRRAFLNACTSAGIASPLLPGILFTLAAQAQEPCRAGCRRNAKCAAKNYAGDARSGRRAGRSGPVSPPNKRR